MGTWGVSMSGIIFQGLVSVNQDNSVIFTDAKNKFTPEGMKLFISFFNYSGCGGTSGYSNGGAYFPAYNWQMYLGTGAAATTSGMTSLASPIGTTPGTVPNVTAITFKDGSSDGIWDIIYSATWNSGTVTGTVAEMALYLTKFSASTYGFSNLTQNSTLDSGRAMMSRLCTGDGEFSGFTIDNTKPLTIDWKIRFTFG
jgi:hypothetical protein